MRYISTFAIPILVASILASCSVATKSYPEGTISLILYRPVDFDGNENLYVDQSKSIKGKLVEYNRFRSLGSVIRHTIEKEGPYCMGLANVKVTRHSTPGAGPFEVEGNPVYRKH